MAPWGSKNGAGNAGEGGGKGQAAQGNQQNVKGGGKGGAAPPSYSHIHGKGGGAGSGGGMNFQESFAMSLGAAMAPIMAQQAGSMMGMSCQPTSGHAGVGGGHGGQGKATAWGPRPAPCQFLDCQWALDGKTIASKADACPGCQRERKKAIAAPLAFCCERAFVSKLRTRAGDLHDHNKEAAKACAGHFRARKVYSGTATAEELAPQLAWRRTQLSSPQAAAQALQDLLVHIAKSSDAAGVTDDGAEDQGGVAATMAGVFSEAAGDLAAPSPPNPKGTPLRLEDHDLGSTP